MPKNPQNIKFENDLIRVRRRTGRPGERCSCTLGHPHPWLSCYPLVHIKLTHLDGQVEEFRVKAGDIRFETGGPFSVETETLGDCLEALRIELKAGKRDRE